MSTEPATSIPVGSASVAARQVLYRFAAIAFLDPNKGAWRLLTALRNEPLVA